ncbi:MAG: aminopeptidase N [Porticoccaceae bacterium]|jgi:aminopeptidase N|nr:aminopeptidase N [Porticoccaceae bacterium]
MALRDSQPKTIYLKHYRVPDFLIDHAELDIDLGESETRVRSTLAMRRNPDSDDRDALLALHGVGLAIQSLAIDGVPLAADEYRLGGEQLEILRPLGDAFQFSAEVIIHPEQNSSLEGLYKSRALFCTQCEAEGFRKITFYLDRPDVMAEFTTTLRADKARYPVLLSNGNPVARGEEGGRHWVTWHDPFKKPAYLFAMVAGDLAHIADTFTTRGGRAVDLRIYVEEKDLDKCDFAMAALKKSMAWDEEVYGREYDLDIFMIVAVDDFNMGAMENKGLNIFNTSAVLAKQEITTDASFQNIQAIVAHEYFHNWSGNRVTCRDWFQLSLKEGFTVFRDSQFSADMGSPVVKRVQDVNLLRTLQFAEDGGPMAHPVQPASYMEISNFYTLTVYEKGSEVVGMIRTLLGPDLFRQGADLYFARHDGEAVTIEDFVAAMEEVSGRDFSQFMNWYRQAGTPRLDVAGIYDEAAKTFALTFKQSCPPTPECADKAPYLIPVAMGLVGPEGDLPLVGAGFDGATHTVLEITGREQTVVFHDVPVKPVPSLLRDFSAPVKLHYPYSRDELLFLMTRDSDGFNRWEACNQLALDILKGIIDARVAGHHLVLDPRLVEAYRGLLMDASLDKAMVALMLTLPSEALLAEEMAVAHPDAIHPVRRDVRIAIARALRPELIACYRENAVDESYRPEPDQIARRALKNTALAYLSLLDEPGLLDLVHRQAVAFANMTDTQAALAALVNSPVPGAAPLAADALARFYARWRDEPLAVNLWFQTQAGAALPGGLDRVRALMDHEAFDIRNPNKVRSLIGAFANNNPVNFHRDDGEGYRFLADRVIELDRLNPQVASRQLTPLTRWRKYPEQLSGQMLAQLRRILAEPGLSPDVFEIASKSLAGVADG